MRLTRMCLLFALLSTTAFAQQSALPSSAPQNATGGSPARTSHPRAKRHAKPVRVRRTYSGAARSKGRKRTAYRPEYTQNAVEVISGGETRRVVFDNAKPANDKARSVPGQLKVEVVNGTSTNTQYFYAGSEQPRTNSEPVVVGIESSDTRVVGGNQHPVVTGITTAGTSSAKIAAPAGKSVTNNVLPRSKRPAYQSDKH